MIRIISSIADSLHQSLWMVLKFLAFSTLMLAAAMIVLFVIVGGTVWLTSLGLNVMLAGFLSVLVTVIVMVAAIIEITK